MNYNTLLPERHAPWAGQGPSPSSAWAPTGVAVPVPPTPGGSSGAVPCPVRPAPGWPKTSWCIGWLDWNLWYYF